MDNDFTRQELSEDGDVDTNGHLAVALFTTGILILLIVIYALALAA